jgi:nucleoside triphosphate pyrophosphatase
MESALPVPLTPPRLILASASPRRQSLLRQAGYEFLVHPSGLDERQVEEQAQLPAAQLAQRLADAKAGAVAERFPNDVVLAADTVVILGEQTLGKPAGAADARRMLSLLSGSTHTVLTAVTVMGRRSGHHAFASVASTVGMRLLSFEEIERYVACGDWIGKAGGYGIQDDDPFVQRLEGCLTNIVGLPMTTTARLLAEAGVKKKGPEIQA